ncbi:MAG: HNH endonuclease, partial [Jatrophihabitans endophyticus]
SGGHTAAHNMLAGCPRHHHLRHDTDWTVTGSPEGTLTWTTPPATATTTRSASTLSTPPPPE